MKTTITRRFGWLVLLVAISVGAIVFSILVRTTPTAAENASAVASPTVIATVPVAGPLGVGVNPRTNLIYAASQSNFVSVIDGVTNSVITTVYAPSLTGYGVAVNPQTNMIYAGGPNNVQVIDGKTNTVTANIFLFGWSTGVAVNSQTNTIYVANSTNATVSVIDGKTSALSATIDTVGSYALYLAVNPTTNTVYVANYNNGTISVIDGATNLVTATISVGRLPYGIAVNSSTNTIYVANFDDNTISVIDGVTNFVKTTVDVGTGSGPLGVAVNPTTNRVFVANDYSNTVSVIDGASSSLVATVPVGLHPIGVGVNPTTNRVYVANSNDNTVSVIADGPGSGANWAFPFAAGTSAQIGLYGIHDDNFSGMQDDRTHATFAFANYTATTALDIVLPPSTLGTSTIPATSVASGTVLAVWAPCQLVLIDHGNGWWATYLHLANIPVTSGDAVTTGSILGYPTTVKPTLSRCKNVNSSAEHVHLAFLRGSDAKRTGTFVTLLGQAFCSHRVLELNSDPTNIILKGLTTTKGQVFTVPSCG